MNILTIPRIITVLVVALIALSFMTVPVFAQTDPFEQACSQTGTGGADACRTNGTDPISGNDGIIMKVVNVISMLGGITAVIVIIIAGFQMVLAGGDAQKVANARSAIIYAIVGIIVIAVIRAIIAFVVSVVAT
jgi:hypothetical protein